MFSSHNYVFLFGSAEPNQRFQMAGLWQEQLPIGLTVLRMKGFPSHISFKFLP